MFVSLKFLFIFVVNFYIILPVALGDVLEAERSSFFGFTHEVPLSLSTLELVEQMQQMVQAHARGDRRVRRYFDAYETPFVGVARRKLDGLQQ